MVTRLKSKALSATELQSFALNRLCEMRTGDIPELDALLKVMADIFNCAIASVCLIQKDVLVFPAVEGRIYNSLPKQGSFTELVVEAQQLLVVEDALNDARFKNTLHVIETPNLRFFAGCPLYLDHSEPIGSITIIDYQPHSFTAAECQRLQQLQQAVQGLLHSQLNVLKSTLALEEAEKQRHIADRKGRLLDEVASVSGVGGWELDIANNQMWWTKRTREIIGVDNDYSPDLESAINFYAPEAREMVAKMVQDGIENTGVWHFEAPLYNNHGRLLWVEAFGQAIYENGELKRTIGAFQDITEKRRQQNRMRFNEQMAQQKSAQLLAVISNMQQGVAVFDGNGLLQLWNQQFLENFGLTEEQVRYGTSFYQMLSALQQRGESEDSPAEFIDMLNTQLLNDKPVTTHYGLSDQRIIEAIYSPLPESGILCCIEDVTEREQEAQQNAHAAHHDILTGLANRKLFAEQLNHAMTQTQQRTTTSQPLAYFVLMMVDLDRFKIINDSHGHSIGDKVLQQVAARLCNAVRDSDLVARLGGDEFAIILADGQPLEQLATDTAMRILAAIGEPYYIDNLTLDLGVSIGLTPFLVNDNNAEQVINRADQALYAVKNSGRNNFRFYDECFSANRAP